MGIKLLQINLGKGASAQDLALQTAETMKVDIILFTEHCNNQTTANLWEDDSKRAAIVVANKNIIINHVHPTNKGFVWAEIKNIRVYSCYFSPNDKLERFAAELDALEESLASASAMDVIITGDFNAKSPDWGEARLDRRGTMVSELIARRDLAVLNTGNGQTFRRGSASSIIDLTLCSQTLARKVVNWRILEEESLSDHLYIYFEVNDKARHTMPENEGATPSRAPDWDIRKLNTHKLRDTLEVEKMLQEINNSLKHSPQLITAELSRQVITNVCKRVMPPRRNQKQNRRNKYWWTPELGLLRKTCIAARRKATRSHGNIENHLEYKQRKKELKLAITKSKERCWKELIAEVENDPWGLPFKIVSHKLGTNSNTPGLNNELWVREIINHLFPKASSTIRSRNESISGLQTNPFSHLDLMEEGHRLKRNKSPGLDGIPNEVLRVVIEVHPKLLLDAYNTCLAQCSFPKIWKRQRVILLRKGNKPLQETSSYRPIFLLDTMGKILEGLIMNRMEKHLEGEQLSPKQYGFRKGLSTVDAIQELVSRAKAARDSRGRQYGFCAIISIDVRNAFNSLQWHSIHKALKRKKFPTYIRELLKSYLSQRKIVVQGSKWTMEEPMTCGAPQGSRLGPLLWNIAYDDLLSIVLPKGADMIGYADDIVIICVADTIDLLEINTNESLYRTKHWLTKHGLEVATEKTKAILVTRRRSYRKPKIEIDGEEITWSQTLTYLGVEIDARLNFGGHIDKIAKKALATTAKVAKLMPNIGGPKEQKRRLLAGVAMSQMLYASPTWSDALLVDKHRKRLTSVQRCAALRITSAYKTISTEAVLVLAGMPPVDLLAIERKELYDESKQTSINTGPNSKDVAKKEARKRTLLRWQERWDQKCANKWYYELIPNIEKWVTRKHGEVDYYLTQVLSGHGNFNSYLHKFKRSESPICIECNNMEETSSHTIFSCVKWQSYRDTLRLQIGSEISPTNLVRLLTETEEYWNFITNSIRAIMKEKETKARRK